MEYQFIQTLLEKLGLIDKIYEAMQHEDLAEPVIAAKELMTKTNILPFIENKPKNEWTSTDFRKQGNQAFKDKMFRQVLEFYNLALLHAPLNSPAMALAYSNRSALLFTVKAYSACLKDIESCLAIGGIEVSIIQRIKKRKRDCEERMSPLLNPDLKKNTLFGRYFQFDVPRHPQIPSVSTDVEVVMEPEGPKIVAARDIKVGTLVAIEEPFVGHLGKGNYFVACYYCHKLSLNLIPCEGCCMALFCDMVCRKRCYEEFHNIECQIIESLEFFSTGAPSRLKVKAALKMRQKCKSWSELITASKKIGANRMCNSSLNEIFDVNNKFSPLNLNNSKHFLFGEMFNASFECAAVISWLEKIRYFFPESPNERSQAMRAIARIMMHLYMFTVGLEVYCSAEDKVVYKASWQKICNWGWFSFTGKLKHRCDANLIMLGLKNNVALTAIHPIKKGTELTISYIGHWYEDVYSDQRPLRLFISGEEMCHCPVCAEKWDSSDLRKYNLTKSQKEIFDRWRHTQSTNFLLNGRDTTFNATCQALAVFQNAANTEEHLELFKAYRAFVNFCQVVATNNETIG